MEISADPSPPGHVGGCFRLKKMVGLKDLGEIWLGKIYAINGLGGDKPRTVNIDTMEPEDLDLKKLQERGFR